jgi:ABC-2 type transport system permease protein
MNAIATLFRREFFGYFRTPVAYVFLAAFLIAQMSLTWFAANFFANNQASLAGFFGLLPWVFLIFIPAVGMRLWSEEKRAGTWELLFTMPVTTVQAVTAKFLAGWAFIAVALALTITLPLTVAFLGDPDWGPVFAGYLGALLMAGAYLALSSIFSALTKNQVIAFVVSVLVIALVFLLLGVTTVPNLLTGIGLPVGLVDAVANLSFLARFDPIVRGLLDLGDLLYFVVVTLFGLAATVLILDR